MNINELIESLIRTAKTAGLSHTAVTDEIVSRWAEPVTASLQLDEDGRHRVPGSSLLWLTPIPILNGMKLTQRQLGNIMANCGVDAQGVEKPAAHLGFDTGTGSADNPITSPVAWLIARQFWGIDPGKPTPPLSPVTRRARFRTLSEAAKFVLENPWVQ